MSLPQTPPEGGGDRAYTHFRYCITKAKAPWCAFVAGPCMWFVCHPSKRTKPCLAVMTGGTVECPRCNDARPVSVVGYLPLYRELDARPVFVVLHEHTRERVDRLRFHERITIGREDGDGEGVWVGPVLARGAPFHSTLPDRNRPADLTETLLRVWGIRELTEWYRSSAHASDTAVSMPKGRDAAPLRSDGQPFSPMTEAAARRFSQAPGPHDAADVLDDTLERLKAAAAKAEPSKNGKHKPKG